MAAADARQIDSARSFVGRVHSGVASVVGYHGNGFCWGFSLAGSAYPHLLRHGAIVDNGHEGPDFVLLPN